jgi:hypothetical protein
MPNWRREKIAIRTMVITIAPAAARELRKIEHPSSIEAAATLASRIAPSIAVWSLDADADIHGAPWSSAPFVKRMSEIATKEASHTWSTKRPASIARARRTDASSNGPRNVPSQKVALENGHGRGVEATRRPNAVSRIAPISACRMSVLIVLYSGLY